MSKMRHQWNKVSTDPKEAVARCKRCGVFRLTEKRPVYDAWGKRVFQRYRWENQAWRNEGVECQEPRQESLFRAEVEDRSQEPEARSQKTKEEREEEERLKKDYGWVPQAILDDPLLRETLRVFRDAKVEKIRLPKAFSNEKKGKT